MHSPCDGDVPKAGADVEYVPQTSMAQVTRMAGLSMIDAKHADKSAAEILEIMRLQADDTLRDRNSTGL